MPRFKVGERKNVKYIPPRRLINEQEYRWPSCLITKSKKWWMCIVYVMCFEYLLRFFFFFNTYKGLFGCGKDWLSLWKPFVDARLYVNLWNLFLSIYFLFGTYLYGMAKLYALIWIYLYQNLIKVVNVNIYLVEAINFTR